MATPDVLQPAQFPGKSDRSDSDRDKAAEYDAKGQDEAEEYGFDEYGYGDSQWNRTKHGDKPEVF